MNTYPEIHIVVKYFYPVAAGIETNIMETYSVLVQKGWKVFLHTSKDTLTEHNTLADTEVIRGITVYRYPWHWYGFTPNIQTKKGTLICLHNFNIVPHVFIMLNTLKDKLLNKKNYTLVLTPHGGYNPEWSTFPLVQRLVKHAYHATIGTLLINASVDEVRAVSEWEREEMITCGLQKRLITVISNGIENIAFENTDDQVDTAFKNQIASLGRYIIQIGRVHTIKNFETTIKALVHAPSDLSFVIAGPIGEPEYKQKLETLIRDLHLQDRVLFFGVVRGAKKYYLIKHAQMMVHMAIWESYCNVVHEGMSQGLVCIVANNTALPLLIKDKKNGYCLPPKDEMMVAEKINYVLEHKESEEIKTIEETNRESVREHSWDRVALRLHEYYQKNI